MSENPADKLYDVYYGSVWPDHIVRKAKPGELFQRLPEKTKEILRQLKSEDTMNIRPDALYIDPKPTPKVFNMRNNE